MTAASIQNGGHSQARQVPLLGLSPGVRLLRAQASGAERWAGAGQLLGTAERGWPGPGSVFTVTTRPSSLRFLNREAPSGWRLERPLVAPPPVIGSFGSQ